MPGGNRIVDPYKKYNFIVEIEGITQAAFQECTGLDSTTEAVPFREGGVNFTVYKLPGKTSYSDIVLKWGITDSLDMYIWRVNVVVGKVVRKNGSIVMNNEKGEEIMRWNFFRAWPTKWQGPDFNATSDEVAIETLTLAHEGVMRG